VSSLAQFGHLTAFENAEEIDIVRSCRKYSVFLFNVLLVLAYANAAYAAHEWRWFVVRPGT
jgi:hypothetical protein